MAQGDPMHRRYNQDGARHPRTPVAIIGAMALGLVGCQSPQQQLLTPGPTRSAPIRRPALAVTASVAQAPRLPLWTQAITEPVDYASFRSFDLAVGDDGSVVLAGDYAQYPGDGYCVYVIQPQYDPSYEGVFISKFDVYGRKVWSKRFAGCRSLVESQKHPDIVAVDHAGNIVLAGSFNCTVDFGGGELTSRGVKKDVPDIFVAKFDATGHHLWSRRLGDHRTQRLASVAVDSRNNIVITGDCQGEIDFGSGSKLQCVTSREHEVTAFVAKLDEQGEHLWSRPLGGNDGQQRARAVAIGAKDVVYVTGSFDKVIDLGRGPHRATGHEDLFVAAFEGTGEPRWSRTFGGPPGPKRTATYVVARAMVTSGIGQPVLAGTFSGVMEFGPRNRGGSGHSPTAFVLALDQSGEPSWVWTTPISSSANHLQLATVADGSLLFSWDANDSDADGLFELSRKGTLRWTRKLEVGAIAYDSTGNIVFAKPPYVAKLSPKGAFGGCEHMPMCSQRARCTVVAGECQRLSSADCQQSSLCKNSGLCALVRGQCTASNDPRQDGCPKSQICREDGKCQSKDGKCVAISAADCAKSQICQVQGKCQSKDGECVAASDDGCRKSQICREMGKCHRKDGQCVVTSDDDCRGSAQCSDYGHCGFSPNIGGSCIAVSTADCRRSKSCRTSGYCSKPKPGYPTFNSQSCEARSDSDCRKSQNCTQKGACSLGNFHKVLGGYVCYARTDADCQRSRECKTHGRCTKISWPGDHPLYPTSCELRNSADCQRTTACKKDGRCRFVDRKCVK